MQQHHLFTVTVLHDMRAPSITCACQDQTARLESRSLVQKMKYPAGARKSAIGNQQPTPGQHVSTP